MLLTSNPTLKSFGKWFIVSRWYIWDDDDTNATLPFFLGMTRISRQRILWCSISIPSFCWRTIPRHSAMTKSCVQRLSFTRHWPSLMRWESERWSLMCFVVRRYVCHSLRGCLLRLVCPRTMDAILRLPKTLDTLLCWPTLSFITLKYSMKMASSHWQKRRLHKTFELSRTTQERCPLQRLQRMLLVSWQPRIVATGLVCERIYKMTQWIGMLFKSWIQHSSLCVWTMCRHPTWRSWVPTCYVAPTSWIKDYKWALVPTVGTISFR